MASYSTSKTFLVALVIVTLVFLGWRKLNTTTIVGRGTRLPQPVAEQYESLSTGEPSVKVQCCTVNQDVKVLGRVLDRCATEEAARLAVEEDIYVSVKTTARYHDRRMLPILQTWFQVVPADRVRDGATAAVCV